MTFLPDTSPGGSLPPLFQLLPIIGFVAPPLSKLHVVVTVSNSTHTLIREIQVVQESIWQRTERRAGVSIP